MSAILVKHCYRLVGAGKPSRIFEQTMTTRCILLHSIASLDLISVELSWFLLRIPGGFLA